MRQLWQAMRRGTTWQDKMHVHERVRYPTVQIRLPDLLMRNLGKFQSGQLEAHACAHANRLGLQRLAIDQIFVVDIGG